MKRFFNVAGPCIPGEHYMLPAQDRCADLMDLIDHKQFFVIHAARQTGKTTLLKSLLKELNTGKRYYGLYCSLETVQAFKDPKEGIPAIVRSIKTALEYHRQVKAVFAREENLEDINNVIRRSFSSLCSEIDRPLVVLFDEADCLSNGTLITFLRQLRDGYVNRIRTPFIHSLALVGMRNIRDYKGKIREGRDTLGSASPFNIVTEAITLRNFTRDEIAALYSQHAEDTGQVFPPEVVDRSYYYTRGQPWLVNALAREVVMKILDNDFSKKILPDMMDQAAERIIQRRDTHIDSLLERLKENRVRRIIEPMITGENDIDYLSDDFEYTRDLGLISEENGVVRAANPIYAEVIARTLNYNLQQSLPPKLMNRWMDETDIHMNDLLKEFQKFWRENSEAWQQRIRYHEAGPQLVVQAFLQRVVNRGARLSREFATGSRRVDLCVHYKDKKYPVELKIRRGEKTRTEGIEQISDYMDTLGCIEGWLVIFDQREEITWEQKITWEDEKAGEKLVHLVGA